MTQIALEQGAAKIPEAKMEIPPTEQAAIDEAVAILTDGAEKWIKLAVREQIVILEELLQSTYGQADRWVREACKAKGLDIKSSHSGEEWMGGPVVTLRNIQLFARSLRDIEKYGVPQLPAAPFTRPNGQVVVPVMPTDTWDKVLFTGFSAEVWLDPEVSISQVRENQAAYYRTPIADREAKVALVLGAGNVSSIGPMDTLYKLFVEGQTVVLKMNPVNAYLGPVIQDAFEPLIRRGFMRIVYGGAQEGQYLCTHSGVQEIHITGSDKTHDAIVWGMDAAEKKKAGERQNDKRVTSELGNVSPIIVVPGPWDQKDLDFQGENIASSLTNNAGFNCNATRVVVQHEGWAQRDSLLESIKRAFQRAPERVPYYPGAEDRQAAFLEAHPDAIQIGRRGAGCVPWTMITGLDPAKKDDICFTTEAWCGVTSEVALSSADVVSYIDEAVEFCNDTLWGTLACSIVVHPTSLKDPKVKAAVDRAIANLRYGSVAVNHWAALAYAFVSTTWGAYPGHTDEDIKSGVGVVHNSYFFDRPQKSVVRGPFRVAPKPAWFVSNKTSHEVGKKLTDFTVKPSPAKVPGMLWSAIRG